MTGGYARAWRSRWSHPIFSSKQEAAVWAWMTDVAAYAPWRMSTKFGPIDLQRGQLLIAERSIAKDFGLHRNAVRRILQRLVDDHMITQKRDHMAGNAGTIVTILNYDKYQGDSNDETERQDHLGTDDETTSGPPRDHLGTTRERTIKTKRNNTVDLAENQFPEFWQEYPSRSSHSNPKKPALQKFKLALKRGVSASEIILGAKNYRAYVEREGTDPKYIAQASTWLGQERWTDHQKTEPAKPQGIAPL